MAIAAALMQRVVDGTDAVAVKVPKPAELQAAGANKELLTLQTIEPPSTSLPSGFVPSHYRAGNFLIFSFVSEVSSLEKRGLRVSQEQ